MLRSNFSVRTTRAAATTTTTKIFSKKEYKILKPFLKLFLNISTGLAYFIFTKY